MSFPLNLLLFLSLLTGILAIVGFIVYRNKNDKLFLVLIMLAEIIYLAIYFGIITNFTNIKLVLSIISATLATIFLFTKKDFTKPYLCNIMHLLAVLKLLIYLNIIAY